MYAFFVNVVHWSIPCPIFLVTHLYCPGCGVTRMCSALLQLDFGAAARYNLGLMLVAPAIAAIFVPQLISYLRTGDSTLKRWQNFLLWGVICWLLLFAVLRNLPAFSFLAPS